MSARSKSIIPQEKIVDKILFIRGHKVMLDRDLAQLYGVLTKNLNKAVMRNVDRFPQDFMFQLKKSEFENLRFQIGTSSWGGRRYRPLVFTEQGVAMLSSVLKSKRAVFVNIAIMRVFVKIRQFLSTHKKVAEKLNELRARIDNQDQKIQVIFEAIRRLMKEEVKPKYPMGFRPLS